MFEGLAPATIHTAHGSIEFASVGTGVEVLALHGAMGGWDQSMILARALLPADSRVLAISRPGYLGTTLAAGRTPEQQADLYAALLDALAIERVAVIAVSGGGPSALQFALRHAHRCRSLVLVSTIGSPMTGRLPMAFHLAMWLGRRAWFARWIRRRKLRDPDGSARRAILDPHVRRQMLADPESGLLFRAFSASSADRIAERLEGTRQDVLVGRGATPPLEAVRVPTLVVHGTADRVVPFEQHGAVLACRIPGAELLAVEGAEHVALFTHRALIQAGVAAFLRAQ